MMDFSYPPGARPRALAQFSTNDPWTRTKALPWLLIVYFGKDSTEYWERRFGENPELDLGLPGPGGRDFVIGEELAIERLNEAKPIRVPTALANLWCDGRCSPDKLPLLVYASQADMVEGDYGTTSYLLHERRIWWMFSLGLLKATVLVVLDGFMSPHYHILLLAAAIVLVMTMLLPIARLLVNRRLASLERTFLRAIAAVEPQ